MLLLVFLADGLFSCQADIIAFHISSHHDDLQNKSRVDAHIQTNEGKCWVEWKHNTVKKKSSRTLQGSNIPKLFNTPRWWCFGHTRSLPDWVWVLQCVSRLFLQDTLQENVCGVNEHTEQTVSLGYVSLAALSSREVLSWMSLTDSPALTEGPPVHQFNVPLMYLIKCSVVVL